MFMISFTLLFLAHLVYTHYGFFITITITNKYILNEKLVYIAPTYHTELGCSNNEERLRDSLLFLIASSSVIPTLFIRAKCLN